MQFSYQAIISLDPTSGDAHLIFRPEIPIFVSGPTETLQTVGLIDSGSDNTVFPKSLADRLGIELHSTSKAHASSFGGHRLPLIQGEVVLELQDESESIRWLASVYFYEFERPEDETVVLGHAGFLEFFTTILDGKETTVTLVSNEYLPER